MDEESEEVRKLFFLLMSSYMLTGCSAFGIECFIKDPGVELGRSERDGEAVETPEEEVQEAVLEDGGEDEQEER